MSYSWEKFLRPISATDTNIQILDNSGVATYTINPFAILSALINNNILKVNLKSGKVIAIPFSTINEAKLALAKIKQMIATMNKRTPMFVNNELKNYVSSVTDAFFYQDQPNPTGTGTDVIKPGTLWYDTEWGFLYVYIYDPTSEFQYSDSTPDGFTSSYGWVSAAGEVGPIGATGPVGPIGPTGASYNVGNGLSLTGATLSVGGTLYETLGMNGGYYDMIATGFDNISMTSSVFDIVSDLISLDSDNTQILAIDDIVVSAGGQLAFTGDSALVSIGNTQGLVYQSDYSSGFVNNSLVSKKYVDDSISLGTPTTDWSLSGSLTVSGTASFSGLTTFQEVTEVINPTPGATASTVVYDFSTGSNWYHTSINTNYTADFINIPEDDDRVITTTIVINQSSTAYIPTDIQINTFPMSIKWAGGTGSGTANQVDIVGFTFIRSGGVWAQVFGQIATFY